MAKEKFTTLDQEYTSLQIVRLTQKLQPGQPCPVCGALDHPLVSQGQVADLAKVKQVEGDLEQAQADLTSLQSDYNQLEGRLKVQKQTHVAAQADYQAELNPNLVLQRADGIIAYNLAVVVDDHRQGITEVVRGADMLSATFLQLALYDLMGYQAPRFCHLPLVLEQASGAKFSKQNHAPALLDLLSPIEALELCLHLLNAIPHPQSLTLIHERLQRYRQNQQPLAPTEHEPVPAEHEPVPTEHEPALAQEEDERLHTLLQQACTRFDPRALPQQALML